MARTKARRSAGDSRCQLKPAAAARYPTSVVTLHAILMALQGMANKRGAAGEIVTANVAARGLIMAGNVLKATFCLAEGDHAGCRHWVGRVRATLKPFIEFCDGLESSADMGARATLEDLNAAFRTFVGKQHDGN